MKTIFLLSLYYYYLFYPNTPIVKSAEVNRVNWAFVQGGHLATDLTQDMVKYLTILCRYHQHYGRKLSGFYNLYAEC
jgi:hypothetical protein